jgi:primosomal protein N' (replication factor Y) (superfamily II helicase)
MYVLVNLIHRCRKPLWYHVPLHLRERHVAIDDVVIVPLRKQTIVGVVVDIRVALSAQDRCHATKDVIAIQTMPPDRFYAVFIKKIAAYYQCESIYFLMRLRQFLNKKRSVECASELTHVGSEADATVHLTQEQQAIVEQLKISVDRNIFECSVLHGVTGSGKTEIYKALMHHTLSLKKSVLFLVPEVGLALSFQKKLAQCFSAEVLYGFHSSKTIAEKKQVWHVLVAQRPVIIIGVHLPILLPINNVGLIIIDEEHASHYQEQRHPKINTKDVALIRAHAYNVPILLGSATPSVASLHNVETKNWKLYTLSERFGGHFPKIKLVSLTDKKKRASFWISNELYMAIDDRLAKKEQTILFLNRRGHSFFIQCTSCSFIVRCHACSVSLTVHEHGTLSCHYCGYTMREPTLCIECKSEALVKKGVGTQQLENIIRALFPSARVARADLDTTAKRRTWEATMQAFTAGDLDIMIGTQTITKGHNFPRVTLVGIIWADIDFHVPFFNATEHAVQQLLQVAGRAGRSTPYSDVIVQSMTQHDVLESLDERLYRSAWYVQELEKRRLTNFPPYKRLVELELKHTNEETVHQDALELVLALENYVAVHGLDVDILGPAKPPVYKIKNIFSRKIYLRSISFQVIIVLYKSVKDHKRPSSLFFTPNPQQ